MDIPLQISFRNMDASDSVRAKVQERAEKLEQHYGHIRSCRVVVEAPERHHHKGNLYHVRIEIGVPGRPELVVNRHPKDKHAHEDVYVAVRDAFDAAQRRLEDHARKIGGWVKTHETPPHGTVRRLFADQGYGFIAASDGQEIYFHKNAVVNDGFESLKVGDAVRLVLAPDESAHGPQASTVQPTGKHHLVT